MFVGDSLNRNMWQSLVCALRASLKDKSKIYEVSGRREFRTQGFFSFKFRVSYKGVTSDWLVRKLFALCIQKLIHRISVSRFYYVEGFIYMS